MTKKKLIYTISSIVLLLDQLIKVLVVNNMDLHQEIKIKSEKCSSRA
jgi:lipoprotein signal peptidase